MKKEIKKIIRVLRTSFRKSPLYHLYSKLYEGGYKKKITGKTEIKITSLGNKMILPTSDIGLSRELIINNGIREKEVLEMIKECKEDGNPIVKPNDNIIEIGANIGYYALQWAKITNSGGGEVYAIEPNPKTFKYLKKNIKINNYDNVHLINKGVSDKKDSLPFYASRAWNLSHFLDKSEKYQANGIIEADSLDNLFKNLRINLIRMDVEGYEYQVLMGAKNILKNNKNIKILMEIHPNKLSRKQKKEIVRILGKNNFEIVKYTDKWANVKDKGPLSKMLEATESQHFLLKKI